MMRLNDEEQARLVRLEKMEPPFQSLPTAKFIMEKIKGFHLSTRTSRTPRVTRCLNLAIDAELIGGFKHWAENHDFGGDFVTEDEFTTFRKWWEAEDHSKEAAEEIREIAELLIFWLDATKNTENPDEGEIFRGFTDAYYGGRLVRNFPMLYQLDVR